MVSLSNGNEGSDEVISWSMLVIEGSISKPMSE